MVCIVILFRRGLQNPRLFHTQWMSRQIRRFICISDYTHIYIYSSVQTTPHKRTRRYHIHALNCKRSICVLSKLSSGFRSTDIQITKNAGFGCRKCDHSWGKLTSRNIIYMYILSIDHHPMHSHDVCHLSGTRIIPGSKVLGANSGPTWVLSALDGPHAVPMNLDIRVVLSMDEKWMRKKWMSGLWTDRTWAMCAS